MIDLKKLVNEIFESLQLGEGDTIEKFSSKGKSTGKLKQGTIRKKLGVKKDEKIPTYKLDKEISRLRKKDKDKTKPGAQLSPTDSKYLKGLTLSKTLRKEGSCGYDRNMEGKKLTTPGGLKETIEFVAENYSGLTQEEIVQEVLEIKKLGKTLTEELCAKGKAYRKRRMAAGEKSSAYLSGRAVKVCKGQMSGKKKKK
mgnify:FL=1|tara:strand:+ start:553 stop:1146 length:594 start_codon:yes stop_codon:yes gene_type:complete